MTTVEIKKRFGETARPSAISNSETSEIQVKINSLNAEPGGTPSKFICKLDRPFFPDEVRFRAFTVSNVIYNLRDAIVLDETGFPPVTATPPPGVYTGSNWPTLFSAWLTSISPSGATYTATLDGFTLKATITSTTLWKFNNVTPRNSTYYAIGYNSSVTEPVQVYALSQTSTGHFDFIPQRGNINIWIREFSSAPISDSFSPYTFSVPSSSISTQTNSYSSNGNFPQSYKHTNGSRIDQLTVELLNDGGFQLPVQGGHTTLTLSFTCRN